MKANNLITGSYDLELSRAILIYEQTAIGSEWPRHYDSRNQRPPLATVHAIERGPKGEAMIAEGRTADADAISKLALSLASNSAFQTFIPANVLCLCLTAMVWHVPSSVRRLWFKTGDKEWDALDGKPARQPALLFIAKPGHRNLRVFALPSDERPTPDTPLYQAPYRNVSPGGHIGLCNVPAPTGIGLKTIPQFEASFFDSAFTHAGTAAAYGGLLKLWQPLTIDPENTPFPTKKLKRDGNYTVGTLIADKQANDVNAHLNQNNGIDDEEEDLEDDD